MTPFDYARPASIDEAVSLVAQNTEAAYLAGGSNLLDHLRLGIAHPRLLVDVTALGLDEITETPDGGLRVGTNVRNSDLAAHAWVREHQPVVARALLAGASGQIRNQATTGGNLLQRTRCVYFQDPTTPCNKRAPGSGCSANDEQAHTRESAILGTSDACVAVHPGDLPVALAAIDAHVIVQGSQGERRIPMHEFHRLPGTDPSRDTTLNHGDLITAVELPAPLEGAAHGYEKVRDRASYAFALVSAAAVLRMQGDTVAELRLAWGGVAHMPWRARTVEDHLIGHELTEDAIRSACRAELAEARTHAGNAFKPAMVTGATASLLTRLATRTQEARR